MAVFTLKPVPPFRLDLTVWLLRRRPINEMDRWDGQTYRRVLVVRNTAVEVAVVQSRSMQAPELTVRTRGGRLGKRGQEQLAATVANVLGLNVDLTPFHRMAAEDPRLSSLVSPFLGFKPPRLPSVFETLLNGIACQQVSLWAGMHLLNRVCRRYGLSVGENHAFPRPVDLVHAAPRDLRTLGFSSRKAEAVLHLAQAIVSGALDLEGLWALDDATALDRLLRLKGIGRWTAQYALLRGLGRLDVFPADDVGGQNKMQRWLRRRQRPGYEQMYRILTPWRPYRGLIYFHLLMDDLARLGLLPVAPNPALQPVREPAPAAPDK
jgi:DNA-3-methyladenine glycosylase II